MESDIRVFSLISETALDDRAVEELAYAVANAGTLGGEALGALTRRESDLLFGDLLEPMVAIGVALSLISFPTGREVRPGEVEQEILDHLGWVYGPGVFLFGVLSVYVFSFYRITRASHARTMEDLVARRLATVPSLEKVS